MKRMRGDTLTGGTNDVNPQYTSTQIVESAANTFTQGSINLPVLRGKTSNGKYQVIELLKMMANITGNDGATASVRSFSISTASKSTAVPNINDPDVLYHYDDTITITTSGLYVQENPIEYDFTDGAGHGLIVATETMFFQLQGVSQTNALTANVRIIYRFKNIGVDEFVGLAIQQNG